MQRASPFQAREKSQIPGWQLTVTGNMGGGHRVRRSGQPTVSSSRPRLICTCASRPGSVKCSRHGYIVPTQKLRSQTANKELIRRALTPPNRRLTLRWLNFRPTLSRLSNMSLG
ncbi:hypothetical protein K2173_007762 [Erythroxylum novogranatense]|uniref:Uncharacterized protein n=1 Tax=Erythroxylum novogranatense TaxID=1862640 RepID=A0AAV8TER3_9ROSI|nr:hypothetical protein K2173_007762 [Erythroxylum novogranatense]